MHVYISHQRTWEKVKVENTGVRALRYAIAANQDWPGTQLPHAVGAAYALKMDDRDSCTVTYFGDGGTSELSLMQQFMLGRFSRCFEFCGGYGGPTYFYLLKQWVGHQHPSQINFEVFLPLLICDGIAVRGQAYGVCSICVDGNDALAMFSAVEAARRMAINEYRPVLMEAITYRAGHHSTSDDSTKYRAAEETEWWRIAQDPLLDAIQVVEKVEKPPTADIFADVYDVPPSNLRKQERLLERDHRKTPTRLST
ncbi:thiamin diphosphate-binding fold (THDP-binding) superfamily protein [Actinidia rufa]|uniref:Thiamin diphosphate-binding fold (THDP-binding) superfamily protein n=1 Tax=Actinidia rufa TaxID=165716 RepID=A0A7J0E1C0_9ERIC|nr:thiamin diphosphate-binding fold (THDP-binding) superfamily protein [Actinidia rufa]